MNQAMHERPHQPEPSEDLRSRFRAGDAAAMEALAEVFAEDVLRYARVVMAGEEEAFEAVQETFLRMLERHSIYDPSRAFRPWLFTICRNCCVDLQRRRSRQRARVVEVVSEGEEALEREADPAPHPLEALIRQQDAELLRAALATLPEHKRTIVMLHAFEDLSFREVASVVGLPAATVATVYYRALAELRNALAAPVERRSSRVS